MVRKVYVAGPMTGIPQFNFPAFDSATACLRADGFDVVTPSELDSPEARAAALASPDGEPTGYAEETGDSWGDLLARDVKLIADEGIEAIIVLPGWEWSRGARLETYVGAALCGLPVWTYPTYQAVPQEALNAAWCGLGVSQVSVRDTGVVLPTGSQERKDIPLVRGCLDYFPAALAAVAELSRVGNEKHNPGEDMHHARGKSNDHADCIVRHLFDRGTVDPEDAIRHSVKVAWRALALLQEELEDHGAPLARGARTPSSSVAS